MLLKVCAWYVLRKALSRPSTPDRDNSVVLFPITYIDVTGLDTQLHPFDWLFNLSTNQQNYHPTVPRQSPDSPQTPQTDPKQSSNSLPPDPSHSPNSSPTVSQQSPNRLRTVTQQSLNTSPNIFCILGCLFIGVKRFRTIIISANYIRQFSRWSGLSHGSLGQ